MAQPALQTGFTRAEFLAWEAQQPYKHEFYQGEVFAMSGVRLVHGTVTLNVATLLKAHLRGKPCRAFTSDIAVEVQAADAVFYPDVVVTCDERDLAAERTLHHPSVVIEVLSPSTAAFDQGDKFSAYARLESLREYVLIDPDSRSIRRYRRAQANGEWLLDLDAADHGLDLPSIDFTAATEAVFEDVPA